jgi:hypothetical protein
MLTPEMLLLLTLLAPMPAGQTLPTDPLQRSATRAMRGDFGRLKPWQSAWYARALETQPDSRRVWLTQYGMWGPQHYQGDDYHIAANPRYMVRGTVVWLSKPGQLRVVTNRGASSNDAVARRRGCEHWVDIWTRYRGQYGLDTTTCEAYVLGRAGGW